MIRISIIGLLVGRCGFDTPKLPMGRYRLDLPLAAARLTLLHLGGFTPPKRVAEADRLSWAAAGRSPGAARLGWWFGGGSFPKCRASDGLGSSIIGIPIETCWFGASNE